MKGQNRGSSLGAGSLITIIDANVIDRERKVKDSTFHAYPPGVLIRAMNSRAGLVPTFPSPSPLPSPRRRGRRFDRTSAHPTRPDLAPRGRRFSLSFGERVGVRGKSPSEDPKQKI